MKWLIVGTASVMVCAGAFAFVCPNRTASSGRTVSKGAFHSVAHEGSGTASILERPGGGYVLELSGVQVGSRPDLWVYLVTAPDARENETVMAGGIMPVAPLPSSADGRQLYDLPGSFDPSHYRSVTIWSQKYSVNFATAPLKPACKGTFMGGFWGSHG